MGNLRTHGRAPFSVAVIHGGPGAAGEMKPVAEELSVDHGVLEPLQTAVSLGRQVEELRTVLEEHAALPVVLIGHSWGAWLSVITAARYSHLVRKLILVSSGPFEEKYVAALRTTRLNRLTRREQSEFASTIAALEKPGTGNKDELLARLGELAAKTDSYDPPHPHPLPQGERDTEENVSPNGDMFQRVWKEAAEMRRTGELSGLAGRIACPVTAIHGDYDPHPADGVEKPLAKVLKNFRFILLEKCGHTPWRERRARDQFYRALRKELSFNT